jgi:hypothetical protein
VGDAVHVPNCANSARRSSMFTTFLLPFARTISALRPAPVWPNAARRVSRSSTSTFPSGGPLLAPVISAVHAFCRARRLLGGCAARERPRVTPPVWLFTGRVSWCDIFSCAQWRMRQMNMFTCILSRVRGAESLPAPRPAGKRTQRTAPRRPPVVAAWRAGGKPPRLLRVEWV